MHGRYLKHITIVYDGEDTDHVSREQKTVTFVALPIFTTDCPRRHTSTKEDEVHPVRALLQSRYRLESTKRRDKEQVITKTSSTTNAKKDHVVHVPQIWALIINKHTIITCAPLDTSVLRGKTIKLMSYADAQQDEATWSVHFTDAQGRSFYLPLRFCKTYFGLVKQIAEDCLHDEYGLIRDQLLKNGPLYRLVTDDNVAVTAESWVQMVEKERTEVIRLRLVDNETRSSRLLITYCDQDGNEMNYESDASSDTSSVFTPDENGSDTTESSTLSLLPKFDEIAPAVEKLRQLQAKLQEAKSKDDPRKVETLSDRLIPSLEDQILELTAGDLGLETSPRERAQKYTRIIFPDQYERRRGSAYQVLGSPINSPTDNESYPPRSSLRARSGSRTRSRLHRLEYGGPYTAKKERSRSAYDISSGGPRLRERYSRSRFGDNDNFSIRTSGSRHVFQDYSFPPRSSTRSRPQSLKIQSQSPPARSRWDAVRSRVINGNNFSAAGTPVSPTNDIYYKPSDKQLARSRWEYLRSQILAGADLGQGKSGEKEEREPISPRIRDKLANAMKAFAGDEDIVPSRRASETTDSHFAHRGRFQEKEKPKVAFEKLTQEAKPKLKRLIQMARKESASLPKLGALPSRTDFVPAAKENQDLPIFLWSTAYKPADIDQLARIPQEAPARGAPLVDGRLSEKLLEPIATTTKVDEFYLYTILSGMHNHLKKPKKISPEYAKLYEKTVEKAVVDVLSYMATSKEMKSQESEASENVGNVSATFVPSKIKFEDTPNAFTRLNDSKSAIFELAGKILHAFVPEGYDAPVVSKYWGALYQILQKGVRIVRSLPKDMLILAQNDGVLGFVEIRLSELYNLIRSIQMGVRTDDGSKQARYQIPKALPAAFQHLVLLLVLIGSTSEWSEYSWNQMQKTFDDCESLLVESRKQLILMIHTDDYREAAGFQAVDSEALLSLILANLVDNLSTERDFHLTEVYSEYTTKVQAMVRDQASVKVYDDIKLLREELDVIKMTLKQQDETLCDFRSTINITHGVASLSVSVIDRMLENIEQRMEDFKELQMQAETARFLAAQSISIKAESNNKAIIVFTVTTIIFLPLSFVTSYLGMNTRDLRNMQSSQTLFWAIGAPVAFVVLSAAILAAFYGTLTQRVTGKAWGGKEKAD